MGDSLCSPIFRIPVDEFRSNKPQELQFQLEVFPNGELYFWSLYFITIRICNVWFKLEQIGAKTHSYVAQYCNGYSNVLKSIIIDIPLCRFLTSFSFRGHSLTTSTRGGWVGGLKNCHFSPHLVHEKCLRRQVGGPKKEQNYFHIVIECPLSFLILAFVIVKNNHSRPRLFVIKFQAPETKTTHRVYLHVSRIPKIYCMKS